MLLFNGEREQINEVERLFQNILCYCLTNANQTVPPARTISKHPMLLFNQRI